jgi:SAM-dependent methyltransferase
MLLTSRCFEEYTAFFDLGPGRLPGRVLDCGSGASSFVAGACARGVHAVGADPVYVHTEQTLAKATTAGASDARQLIAAHQNRFSYTWYGSAQRRDELRATAAQMFSEHRNRHPERYVAASLPALPFADQAFALALCSHLLFTWADRLDERWHLDSLVELCRVAAEARVFPLVLQGSGEPVPFLPRLRRRLQADFGITSKTTAVDYEFQIGADHMLTLTHEDPSAA